MIKENEPISLCETKEYLKKSKDSELNEFIKNFSKLDVKVAKELRKKLEKLDLLKLKKEDITKIIEILPQTKEELNKIFNDFSLDENETQTVLSAVKEFE